MVGTRSARRWVLIALSFALWLLEWIFGWSGHLGAVGEVIGLLWFIGLGYFVLESRSGRLPRVLHAWGWMVAVLMIAALRAWWIGGEGLLVLTELSSLEGLGSIGDLREFRIIDALLTSMLMGWLIGVMGVLEAAIIGVMSWIGDHFREDRAAPRVAFVPRLVVVLLQAPIFLVLMGVGLAAVAGALGDLAHPDTAFRSTHSEPGAFVLLVLGLGLGAWALAGVLLGRLNALAGGALVTRTLLGLFAVLGAGVLAVLSGSVHGAVLGLVWLALQLAAIRWARPNK